MFVFVGSRLLVSLMLTNELGAGSCAVSEQKKDRPQLVVSGVSLPCFILSYERANYAAIA